MAGLVGSPQPVAVEITDRDPERVLAWRADGVNGDRARIAIELAEGGGFGTALQNPRSPRYAEPQNVMTRCRRCDEVVEREFRYCPWCSAPLRIKVTDLFQGRDGQALRVSRYFADEDREPEVRVSVWSEAQDGGMRADAAVSLDEEEAARLGDFLAEAPAPDEAQTL